MSAPRVAAASGAADVAASSAGPATSAGPAASRRSGRLGLVAVGTVAAVLATGVIGMTIRPGDGDGGGPGAGAAPLALAPVLMSPTPSVTVSKTRTAAPTKKPEPEKTPKSNRVAPAPVVVRTETTSTPARTPKKRPVETTKVPKATRTTKKVVTQAVVPKVVSVRVPVSGGMTVKAYFGRLQSVTSSLAGSVTFNTAAAWYSAHPNRCVLTAVYSDVSGSSAAVYAQGHDGAWSASESAPDQSVATDGGRLHHQLISPPASTPVGQSWSLSSLIVVDGTTTYSGSYTLSLASQDGSDQVWSFAGSKVSCDLT
ncbi:hypothetical protein [Kineosporia sp. NBRC 101731]|uniref:hypothetical protein n=1 Tax=Kineosporia sp. NBRC 101731 TaxID=3032199 RepID=UPI0025530251|nr:hypothetical protein [Kineosporia sp. NBRC 101731]